MRSRYTAYALDNADYIMNTTHPDGPHYQANRDVWKREIEAFSQGTRFAELQILSAEGDTVTFRATLFQGSQDVSFTEKSLFRQLDRHWLYVEAI
jgi:SEC-C motif-containing protein